MAKQENVALFEESSQGSVSLTTVVGFVLSLVLTFGGMVFATYAFGADSLHWEIFAIGLAATILGLLIPFTIIPAMRK